MKKVLVIQNKIVPYRIPFFRSLARSCDLTVLYFSGHTDSSHGFKTIRYEGKVRKLKGLHYTPGLKSLVGQFDAAIVMFDIWWLHLAMLPFSLKRTKSIMWGHGLGRTNGFRIAAKLRSIVAKKADALLFYTSNTKSEFVEKTGVDVQKCFVASNTLEVANHGMGKEEDKSYFLYLGRIQARKRLDELVAAYAALTPAQQGKCSLMIVGDGDEAVVSQLKAQAAQLGIADKVVFRKGTYVDDEIKGYYTGAVAAVSPGAVGLSVVHSFAYGVPVITRADEHHGPEFAYCSDENSYLYTGDGLQATLVQCLEDKTLWRKRTAAAYATFLKECDLSNMVKGFMAAVDYTA